MALLTSFNQLLIFGDSLTDPGNVFNVTVATNAIFPGIVPISPAVPPYDSRGRITNGDPLGLDSRSTWADFLADSLGFEVQQSTALALYDPAVQPSPPFMPPADPSAPAPVLAVLGPNGPDLELNTFFNGATAVENINFAFGGATSGDTNVSDTRIPGVLRQIDAFLADLAFSQNSANPQALYTIWGGSNDFDPIASGTPVDPNGPVSNAETAIASLHGAGGRTFLVHNLPDLGIRPFLESISDSPSEVLAIREEYSTVTQEYNELLTAKLADLSQTISDIQIVEVQVYDLLTFVRDNASFFGFTNIDDSFLTQTSGSADPDEFIFWDGEHPTRAAHQILGEFTHQTLTASLDSQRFLIGTTDVDMLVGGEEDNRIYGRHGNDLLISGAGDDRVLGGSGNDLINGGAGNDTLSGGSGSDRINGSVGRDVLIGGGGDDFIQGGFGNDILIGTSGSNTLEGGHGNDWYRGGRGPDTFVFGRDLLDGRVEVDTIVGYGTEDFIDLDAYREAGGSVSAQRIYSRKVQLTLTDSFGIRDRVSVFGDSQALSDLSSRFQTSTNSLGLLNFFRSFGAFGNFRN
ncbi:MAG: SGNH/GDSL hydrolase family protein [Cyanobacteria bacterium P01_F01_bin.42]